MSSAEAAWIAAKRGERQAGERAALDGWIVAAVFALALGLRLFRLDAEAIWLDEAASLGFARVSWSVLWSELRPVETNPLGYYALLKLWVALAGTSEFALRLPSAVVSALCVVPLYFLCLRLFDRRAAVLAALLLALAAVHVEYGQEARAYAVFFLLFTSALLAAAGLAEAETWRMARRRDSVLLGVLGAGLVWMHGTAPVALVAINVFVLGILVTRRTPWMPVLGPLLVANLIAAALAAPALITVWTQMQDPNSAVSWIPRPTLADAGAIYARVLGHEYLVGARPWADAIVAFGLLAAAWTAVRDREGPVLGLLAALVAVLVAFYALSQRTPILLPRTVLFALALAVPLVAYGLTRARARAVMVALIAAALAAQAKNVANYFAYGAGKEPWREVVAAAAAAAEPETALVISGPGSGFAAVAVEYYWPPGQAFPPAFVLANPSSKLQPRFVAHATAAAVIAPETVCPALQGFQRIVVVTRRSSAQAPIGEFTAALQAAGASAPDSVRFGNLALRTWSGIACP